MKARAALVLALAGCTPSGTVTRIADGAREDGRYIDTSAYSAYARASLLEAAGDLSGALEAYEAALDSDPESADVMTRIGALHCRADRQHPERAMAAFSRALELDSTYSAAYAARARCLESHGKLERALEQALLAVQYDPLPVEQTELVARLLFSLRRPAQAWAWLEGLVSQQPSSVAAWRTFRGFAERQSDAVRLRRARLAEQRLGVAPAEQQPAAGDALDALLLARNLEGARRQAVAKRWNASALALRACEVGAWDVALGEGQRVLLADPADADAWIAVLVAADELHDQVAFRQTLRVLDLEALVPSPRGAELLAALLARRVSEEAARAFRERYGKAP